MAVDDYPTRIAGYLLQVPCYKDNVVCLRNACMIVIFSRIGHINGMFDISVLRRFIGQFATFFPTIYWPVCNLFSDDLLASFPTFFRRFIGQFATFFSDTQRLFLTGCVISLIWGGKFVGLRNP